MMAFDELTFHHRLARPGTIVEVGANRGVMTAQFAAWENQKVIAFEPFPPIYQSLVSNLTSSYGGRLPDRVSLRPEALGAQPGRSKMRVPKTNAGIIDEWASLAKTFEDMHGVDYEEIEVPVATLDGFGLADVTAMKIDAEGYEQEVLIGARRTIERCRPILSIETEERHRLGCTYFIPGYMEALNYDGLWYDHRADKFRFVSTFDQKTMQQASSSPAEDKYGEFYIFIFYYLPRENYELRLRLNNIAPILT